MRFVLALIALIFAGVPALAAPLTITKSASVVSDPLGNLLPRSLPGAVVDYRITATNPLANTALPVRNVVLVDVLPDHMTMRVSDLISGKGPVEFTDAGLSGLSLAYSASAPTTDGLEFWNGTTWTYQPVPDANGYDANVRAVRVTLGGTFATLTSFQLRFRMKIQ